jgi:hypothetical protein
MSSWTSTVRWLRRSESVQQPRDQQRVISKHVPVVLIDPLNEPLPGAPTDFVVGMAFGGQGHHFSFAVVSVVRLFW